jgi:hypothetical protein
MECSITTTIVTLHSLQQQIQKLHEITNVQFQVNQPQALAPLTIFSTTNPKALLNQCESPWHFKPIELP